MSVDRSVAVNLDDEDGADFAELTDDCVFRTNPITDSSDVDHRFQ